MAHQCLKCGKSYPDGSPQILKGCEGCKGTRFFYTDAPLDASAREELAGRTEIDIERLALGKGAREAAGEQPRRIPTKDELPVGRSRERDQDWVAGGPNYLRGVVEDVVRRAQERKPVFRVGAPTEAKSLAEWVREQSGDDPVEASVEPHEPLGPDDEPELLDDLFTTQREAAWREDSPPRDPADPATPVVDEEAAPAEPHQDDVVYQRGPRRIPKPVSLAGVAVAADEDAAMREAAQRAQQLRDEQPSEKVPEMSAQSGVEESLYPEGQVPETVAVRDGGVYELDVKRLLEKNPIVVHKDGTYSLHLPSLMESLDRRKRR